ncbi:MAG: division/cell wall cluster transcriptional repressor MraZ [Spirochaetaceae bacterium]
MLMGEYKNSIDDKGRLLLPSRLRGEIAGNTLILTRGVDRCLWLFPQEEWRRISQNIMESSSMFKSRTRLLQRRIIAPAQECEIDKTGRISIPLTLRETAGLKVKNDAIILGIDSYVEIWDTGIYNEYLSESEEEFQEAAEQLGELLSH